MIKRPIIKKVTLTISDTTCKHCMRAIQNTVNRLPGILSFEMENKSKQIKIDLSYQSGKISFEKIREAIVELGYNVSGYIIHEHSHFHGDISHAHSHAHGKDENEDIHSHVHKERESKKNEPVS